MHRLFALADNHRVRAVLEELVHVVGHLGSAEDDARLRERRVGPEEADDPTGRSVFVIRFV